MDGNSWREELGGQTEKMNNVLGRQKNPNGTHLWNTGQIQGVCL